MDEKVMKLGEVITWENAGTKRMYFVRGLAKAVNFVPASRNGSSYIDLTLVDNTGEFRAKIFGDQLMQRETAMQMNGHVIEMTGIVELHDGQPRFQAERTKWNVLNDSQIEDWNEFAFHLEEEDIRYLTAFIESYIFEMDDTRGLKDLVKELFNKHARDLAERPAGHDWHHAYNGGLLRHIAEKLWFVGRANPFLKVAAAYPTGYDRDMVIAGCILSDFDKIRDVAPFPRGEKSAVSRQRSTTEVFFREEVLPIVAKLRKRKKRGIMENEVLALEHVLMAGSINATGRVNPYTVEADLVALGDRLSAEMDHFGCFAYANYTRTDNEQYSKMLGRFIEVRR